jgi:polyisoprenoid-binding protein YceI
MNANGSWSWKRWTMTAAAGIGLTLIVAVSRAPAERLLGGGVPAGSAQIGGTTSASPAAADLPIYRIRPAETRVSFTVTKLGVFRVEGRFRQVEGKVAYDPKRPGESRVGIRIKVASLDTNEPSRDDTVRSEDFLFANRYPEMAFVSHGVEVGADGELRLRGDLTIRGVTRAVDLPVRVLGLSVTPKGTTLAGFETELKIDRRDFGVLGTRWSGGRALIGNEVSIHILIGAEQVRG